jgi:hypothetical protein
MRSISSVLFETAIRDRASRTVHRRRTGRTTRNGSHCLNGNARHGISPIAVVGCASFPQEPLRSDFQIERSLQEEVRFDSLLDLVKRETELTQRTRCLCCAER